MPSNSEAQAQAIKRKERRLKVPPTPTQEYVSHADYAKLQDQLKSATEKLKEQDDFIKTMTSPKLEIGLVYFVLDDTVVIGNSGNMLEVAKPPKLKLVPGSIVRIKVDMDLVAIVDVSPLPHTGESGTITNVFDNGTVEVNTFRGKHILIDGTIPKLGAKTKLQNKDTVLLDSSGTIVLRKIEIDDQSYAFAESVDVAWEDVGGLHVAKAQLKEAIEEPYLYPELFKFYKLTPPKGFLFHGMPGNGKTLLGKAAASALARLHKSKSPGFFYVKGPEVLSKWVGEAEGSIRSLFENARRFRKREGYPPIIFIDEAESLLSKRGTGISSDMEKTIVPMFLSEMDGMDSDGAMVILATNRADRLDEAIVREGRVDRKIKISRPETHEDIVEVFKVHLRRYPMREDIQEIAFAGTEHILSDRFALYHVEHKAGKAKLHLHHMVSGAMIAGIVQTAVSLSVRHAIDSNKGKHNGGLSASDMEAAVHSIYQDNLQVNHELHIMDFLAERGIDYREVSIHRVVPS